MWITLVRAFIWLLGIDDPEPLECGDLAEPLVVTDEIINRSELMDVKCDAELERIESANLTVEPVVGDQISGAVKVSVEQPEDSITTMGDVTRKQAA